MQTITKRRALTLVNRYSKAEPERSPRCEYVRGGRPECIVGKILIEDFGIAAHVLEEVQGVRVEGLFDPDRATTGYWPGAYSDIQAAVHITPAALRILTVAQDTQDSVKPWGEIPAAVQADLDKHA